MDFKLRRALRPHGLDDLGPHDFPVPGEPPSAFRPKPMVQGPPSSDLAVPTVPPDRGGRRPSALGPEGASWYAEEEQTRNAGRGW